jgi:hypothetical protein
MGGAQRIEQNFYSGLTLVQERFGELVRCLAVWGW